MCVGVTSEAQGLYQGLYQGPTLERWDKITLCLTYNGMLVPVRTSLVCVVVEKKRIMYQRKVDVDMLCSDEGLTLETSANTLFTTFSISKSTFS